MIASVERQMYYNNITAQHSFLIDVIVMSQSRVTSHVTVMACVCCVVSCHY